MMKRLFFVVALICFLGVCYTVVTAPSSNEKIAKEFVLHPDPDPVRNRERIERIEGTVGPDLVRVDVKQAITRKYASDKQKVHLMSLMAANATKKIRAYEGFVKAKTQKEKDKYRKKYLDETNEYTKLIVCLGHYYEEDSFDLGREVLHLCNNTRDRKIHARIRSVLAPAVIEFPTYEEELEICQKYKIQ
ncbi:MAG: hypothetical protein GY793_04805 [Proteobacteria bacterium]|nr:hypothetical protein [Pseudomonadota bacterium]